MRSGFHAPVLRLTITLGRTGSLAEVQAEFQFPAEIHECLLASLIKRF
jgi:hypothetical protein